jgi:hypothetical protein
MDTQMRKDFLFHLMGRLFVDLGAHLSYGEWVKLIAAGEDLEGILAQCRLNPALKPQLDIYMQELAALAAASDKLDLDLAHRKFLEQWSPKGQIN